MLKRSLQAMSALIMVGLGVEAWALQTNTPSPEAKAHYARARHYLIRLEEDKAIKELKAAIQLAPEFVEAQQLYLDQQQVLAQALVGEYEGYVKEHPTSAIFRYLLGKVRANANFDRPELAEAEYQKALEMDPMFGWAWLELSRLASRRGEQAKASDCLEKARKSAGDSVELRSAIASALNRAKQFKSALKDAERVLKLDASYFEAYPLKWQAKLNLENGSEKARAEVAKEIRALEAKYAQNLDALVIVQKGYEMLEDEEGKQRLKKAITALDPKFFDRRSSAILYLGDGKKIRVSSQFMQRRSDALKISDPKARLEALRQLEKEAENQEVKHFVLYPSMLSEYLRQDDFENAERLLETMKKSGMEPSSLAEHQIRLAQVYWRRRITLDQALELAQGAVEGLRQSLAQPSGDVRSTDRLRWQLADALYLHAQLALEKKDAQERAEANRQLQKERLEAYLQLEKEIKDTDLKLNSVWPRIFGSYLGQEDLEGAERTLETMKTAGMEPSRLAQHQVSLARTYARWKIKLDRAHELVQGAIEKLRQSLTETEAATPRPTYVKATLADALHVQHQILTEKGLTGPALDSLVESVKLNETEGNTLDLGLAYSKAGKSDEAIELLAKAYGFDGGRKNQAKAAIAAIYGERENAKPLTALLAEAVEDRKKRREEMMASPIPSPSMGRAESLELKPAPEFELATLKGKKMRLSDFRGKVVVLNFWATW